MPLRSAKLLMLLLSDLVTTTPVEMVYGVEKSYLALRSSLMEIWLAIVSKRLDSRPAKIPSNWVSWKVAFTPSFPATAWATSTSNPVSSPAPSAWKLKGR
ncbi:hypothetical protein D3C73_1428010 [compost metagenome]